MADALLAPSRRTPQALAITCGAVTWTHAELAAQADAEAGALRAAGLGQGASLGWLALNAPRQLALLLACAAAGVRLVPLNTRLAAPELAAIARHAGLAALWHDDPMAPLAEAVRAAVGPEGWHAGPAEGHEAGDAMLVYTSGTTGQPRGAVHTQAGMAANIAAALAVQPIDAGTVALAVLPLFHVGGLCIQVLPTLAAGGHVVLHPRFDAGAWLRDVAHGVAHGVAVPGGGARQRPTTSLLVPAVMRALLEHPGWPAADLSSLAFVNSGSSVVPPPLIEAFHVRGVPVAQVYGTTETGPVSVALHPRDAMAHVGACGTEAPGVTLRLLGGDGRDVPPGGTGQMWLKAPNLMRAYHREPLSAAFDADGGFRPGDLARRDDGGIVTVVGRGKDMIVSGGENIYPAEIENLLAHHPAVAECAVVGVPDARWGEVPVLVVLPHDAAAPPDEAALRRLFDARLARYKHPRRIVIAADLPRTALGKVRKAELARRLAAIADLADMANAAEMANTANTADGRPGEAGPTHTMPSAAK
jgi:fatty-acyl-CoA synthase